MNDRFAPIVLKKSFSGDERNFLGPLMRFARGDVRDQIVSHKNDHSRRIDPGERCSSGAYQKSTSARF
jgi:hypothetical protein